MRDILIEGEKVRLRNVQQEDLKTLWSLKYGEEKPIWREWDTPYMLNEIMDFPTYITNEVKIRRYDEKLGVFSELIIEKDHQIIGAIVYYWEHVAARWLEIGITIYEPNYWNGGYGTEAINLFIPYLFQHLEIERVGLTTWSGNERMMAVAKKVGMQLEGRMRKCIFHKGIYYDSIRMGMLREEWEVKNL
ncbi:GNAT family N-acetyltransferase [Peribacillus sp. NPDC097295]|uniref:GNAT family N-acetyltransferase n=1 Tax=Peribacillus sp. NPDC097295 TaxID=3364402 RepID=UPI00382C83C7